MEDEIQVRFRCDAPSCSKEGGDVSMTIKKYQLGLAAIWFHSFHEGHKFSYWEDGELILGQG